MGNLTAVQPDQHYRAYELQPGRWVAQILVERRHWFFWKRSEWATVPSLSLLGDGSQFPLFHSSWQSALQTGQAICAARTHEPQVRTPAGRAALQQGDAK